MLVVLLARKEQEDMDSDFEVLMKSAHSFAGSRDELNHKDHSHDKTSKLKQRWVGESLLGSFEILNTKYR